MKVNIKNKTVAALIFVIGAAAVICGGLYIWDQVMRTKDARHLQDCGYQYAMGSADYSLSYQKIGNDAAKHIVVTIAGIGADDFTEALHPLTACLQTNTLAVCIDRAGYGLSNDTHIPQTIDRAAADYRAVLKNAGIEPPYILMPHAYGAVIAAYWESQYPDEIEGIFFLDGDVPNDEAVQAQYAPLTAWTQRLCSVFGLTRLIPDMVQTLPPDYSPVQRENAEMLSLHSFRTFAKDSEEKLLAENYKTAYENLVTTDIPKVYLNAGVFRSAEEWLAADDWARTFRKMPEQSDTERQKAAEQAVAENKQNAEAVIKPYTEQLGNCEYIEISGDPYIYMHKPAACAVLFSRFLSRIEDDGTETGS